ncbi:Septum formation [Streptomyces zhaozhouensis]|uniref:Septum formation n=1 Tax=Streptomyces zhaozhouensis TaxID=1300267 RepID=A0A286DJH6_9ACTN|nr:Septum formation [Streptomyces zhaozhouensis]
MAVWAFVASLVALFPVALALGVVALGRLAGGRGRGRGLATAALALAGAQVVALAVGVSWTVMEDDVSGNRVAEARERERPDDEEPGGEAPDEGRGEREELVFGDVEAGDCFDTVYGMEATADSVTVVPCEGPHDGEVFGAVQLTEYLPDDAFPGADVLLEHAERECSRLVPPYVLDTWAVPLDVTTAYYRPEPEGWEWGDREILCFFGQLDGEPLTGSLRGDAAALDAESLAYLELTGPLEIAVWAEPVRGTVNVAGGRLWAREMVAAIEDETEALPAHDWSLIAEPVARLVEAREVSLGVWREAASARDEDSFWAAVDEGYATMGIDVEFEIRELLGLATE